MIEMNTLKAVLFDLDGLIADTEALHVSSYHKMADYLGIKLKNDYIHSFIGVATKDNVNRIIKDFKIDKRPEEVLKLRYRYYLDEIRNSELKPMEGAEEAILFVRKLGLKTALVTSSIKDQAVEVLKKIFPNYISSLDRNFGITIFDLMIFGDEVYYPKPDPEIYLKTSVKLNVKPNHCLVFEDSEAGVLAAKSAGMYVIAVPNYHTKNQNFAKADYIIESLKKMPELFQTYKTL